jgi:hypothetical protein
MREPAVGIIGFEVGVEIDLGVLGIDEAVQASSIAGIGSFVADVDAVAAILQRGGRDADEPLRVAGVQRRAIDVDGEQRAVVEVDGQC